MNSYPTALNVRAFYEEHIKALSQEQQMHLIAYTAEEIARSSFGQPTSIANLAADDDPDALVSSAWKLYDEKLKAILEPKYLGQVVAIDMDSEDYEVAKRSAPAWRALRARRPNARVVVIDIGPVSPNDPLELRRNGVLSSRRASE